MNKMNDGGFNCRKVRSGAKHSSVHSTIAILEGLHEYFNNGYTYRLNELEQIRDDSEVLCWNIIFINQIKQEKLCIKA